MVQVDVWRLLDDELCGTIGSVATMGPLVTQVISLNDPINPSPTVLLSGGID